METRPLTIAVTGHRILADLERLRSGIEKAVASIRSAFPRRQIRVISQLAEGADRVCAEMILLLPGAEMLALLPMPRREYVKDFGPEGSPSWIHFDALLARAKKTVILSAAESREESYARAGTWMVARCDVLLAVSDNLPAQGRGGTSEVIAEARARHKPIVIVLAGNRKPGTLEPTSLGREQGRVLVEGLPRRR